MQNNSEIDRTNLHDTRSSHDIKNGFYLVNLLKISHQFLKYVHAYFRKGRYVPESYITGLCRYTGPNVRNVVDMPLPIMRWTLLPFNTHNKVKTFP